MEGCRSITLQGIAKMVKICPKIHTLDLRGTHFEFGGVTDDMLVTIGSHLPHLRHLRIWNAVITDKGLVEFGSLAPQLEELDIWNARKVSEDGIRAIVKGCPNLRELNLSHLSLLTNSAVQFIASEAKQLEVLNISRTGANRLLEGVDALAKGQLLFFLSFSSSGVCNLKALKLRYYYNMKSEAIVSLAKHLTRLEEIDIGGGNYVDDTAVSALATHCPNMKVLDLWASDVTNEGLEVIGKHCVQLRKLELWDCSVITDTGVKALTESVAAPHLEKLILRGCTLLTGTVDIFGDAFRFELGSCGKAMSQVGEVVISWLQFDH